MSFEILSKREFTSFTENQKQAIRTALTTIEPKVKEQTTLSQDELEFIKERIEYLSDALDRLNRFDWKSLFWGTIFSIFTNLIVDTQTGETLLNIFKQVFR
jgi:hypothetical protein